MAPDDPPPCSTYDYSAGERPSAAYWWWFDQEFGSWTKGSRGRTILRGIGTTLHKKGKWRGHVVTITYDPASDRMTVEAALMSEPWEAMKLTWAELLDLVRAQQGR